ncbi:immunodominant staphylococcal antigen IsaB family protein [Staphylococcus simulans]|uniref:immunodominant staphylococcal antigen IsaB family protein n=1 Tax=Staphylococcus simulans TaxID=1286 RepID=UPI000D038EFF|nr:hypothetical protein [Staphylococcus simulans]
MKKVIIATGVTLTTVLGASLASPIDVGSQAAYAESEQPYYNYTGYASNDSSFILDPNFKRAIEHDNVTFNGHKIDFSQAPAGNLTSTMVYDQMLFIKKDSGKVVSAEFPGHSITKAQIEEVYGPPTHFKTGDTVTQKDSGTMFYNLAGRYIAFDVHEGQLTNVYLNPQYYLIE